MKQKWKNLRDCYIKYLKILKGGTGSSKKYHNWPWAGHLEFLRDTIAPRLTSSNVTSEPSEIDEDDDIQNDREMLPPPPKKMKRNKVTEDVATVLNYLTTKNESKTKLGGVDHLFLSYAQTFKKLNARKQALMKMELTQLFGKAELEELQLVQTPSPGPSTSTDHSLHWSDDSVTSPPPISSAQELYDQYLGDDNRTTYINLP